MSDEAPDELTVELETGTGVPVLVVRGELDAYSAPTLDASVEAAIARGSRRLVIDLEDVGFIDSSGLRSLIRARKQLGDEPEALQLRRPQPATVRLLQITGLTEHFPVV
jgi:anti-sigma B factor antagonist